MSGFCHIFVTYFGGMDAHGCRVSAFELGEMSGNVGEKNTPHCSLYLFYAMIIPYYCLVNDGTFTIAFWQFPCYKKCTGKQEKSVGTLKIFWGLDLSDSIGSR
jgi:hypothetical protein